MRCLEGGLRNRAVWASILAVVILVLVIAGLAQGERSQYGTVIVSLDGQLSPLTLPREHSAPVAISLKGRLQTADGSPLPRVTEVQLGLPQQGVLSTHGLPTCPRRELIATSSVAALRNCREALVGHGQLNLTVRLPHQKPFPVQTHLLAFNAHLGKRHAVFLHAFTPKPPFSVVLPFALRRGSGRFGLTLAAKLPVVGKWARVAEFEMTLSRRYAYRGRRRSYLSASCPIPKRFTAGFFSLARVAYRLAGGRQVSTAIARSCRAR